MVNGGCRTAKWSPVRLVLQWSLQQSVGVLQQRVAVGVGGGVLQLVFWQQVVVGIVFCSRGCRCCVLQQSVTVGGRVLQRAGNRCCSYCVVLQVVALI